MRTPRRRMAGNQRFRNRFALANRKLETGRGSGMISTPDADTVTPTEATRTHRDEATQRRRYQQRKDGLSGINLSLPSGVAVSCKPSQVYR